LTLSYEHLIGSPTAPPPSDSAHDPPDIHRVFDNAIPPVLTVPEGTIVAFECPGMALPPEAQVEDLAALDPDRPHTIVGPVAIEGAEPGDTLMVEILDVELIQNHGHTIIIPGLGLLSEDFPEPYVHNFTWEDGARTAELRPGVHVPLSPFCGILGLAPGEPGEHSTPPPRATGGNVDIRHLVPGTTLWLPVEAPGALFFCGDGHGAQGDGEVCITALETAVRATLRFSLDRRRKIQEPQFLTRSPLNVDAGAAGYYATSAVGPDLYACSQQAVRHLIEYLQFEHDLSRIEAYVLCSLAADLKINEIVDAPNWIVSAYLPLSVFTAA
jgi:acetamidase/formamidase